MLLQEKVYLYFVCLSHSPDIDEDDAIVVSEEETLRKKNRTESRASENGGSATQFILCLCVSKASN